MAKRKSVTGWLVYRPEAGIIRQYDDIDHVSVYVFQSRQAALDNATGGTRDKRWQSGILKNGYNVSRVRLTVTVLDETPKLP